MAMITSAFPPQHRGRALGINVSAVYLGLTMAPLLGGLMTEMLGWRSIFWLNVPFGLVIIPLTVNSIRGDWRDARGESFDLKGSVIYATSIAVLMYGFSTLPQPLAVALTILGVLGMAFFVIYENRASNPIINLKLFTTNKVFAYSNLAALINYAATFAVTFVLSLFLQYIKGLDPTDSGLILVTQPVLMTLVASFSGRLSDRVDPRILASSGMGIIVIGLVMLIFVNEQVSSAFIISSLVVLGIGFGMFSSPNTNSVMSCVEKRFLGVASATIGTMRLAGQMLSMAIATMMLHVFLGNQRISAENHSQFQVATKLVFGIFAALCLLGVFASLKRGKK
jgi:MFS family permease